MLVLESTGKDINLIILITIAWETIKMFEKGV